MNDPIYFSIIFGILTFVISFVILYTTKPKIIKKGSNINWFKLSISAIILGIFFSICLFLIQDKERLIEYSNMAFNSF